MTRRWRRSGRVRRVVLLVVGVLVATVSLGGCTGVFGGLLSTKSDVTNAGYSSVSVNFVNSETDLTVSATSSSAATPADTKEIAGIVWRNFHLRFGALTVKVHEGSTISEQTFTFDRLQQIFGPRNPSYNKTSVRQSLEHVGILILIIGLVVVTLIVLLIVWIVHRRRKKRRLAQPATWGQMQGYGPPASGGSGGPPAWGQPPGYSGPPPGYTGPPPGYRGPPPQGQPTPQGQPSPQGQGRPPSGGPAPGIDPWGRPVAPSSGWDQPGSDWGQSQGSGWGQPGEVQTDPGAPPPSSGWGEDTGPDR